ncbi:hypothetical protein EW026_g6829 [Hermanssonia centrifuga]|uniref:Uncharacterized protein n=1 Tax=Hermanssonia centrifuga TaxID=98765 RepID=A0A4V3X9L8_9APHY|nr:hypothetical protein EW026_g6829 [Hermanssonia centrifuga]
MAAALSYAQDTLAKPLTTLNDSHDSHDPLPDKISAYYSLVFPNFTYYLQTLNVTIGRRCIPTSTASSSDNPQVDVDLGPLKSVSRLHAKIEYDEDEERFVLAVVGRNGAWVDGVWSGSGSQVPLGDRFKSTKKRKKSDADAFPRMKPEDLPPKPQFTYAQLCYRAIKGLDGRGSLQEICQWIQDTYEWYKYSDKDWESSVRHNLSSNRAFKKVERGPEEKGKGALWSLDPQYEHTFEEQDCRKQIGDGKASGKKGKSAPLEPALRRSVKVMKNVQNNGANAGVPQTTNISVKLEPSPTPVPTPFSSIPLSTMTPSPSPSLSSANTVVATSTPGASTSSVPQAPSSLPVIPPSVRLPIVIGPAPASSEASNPEPKPIVLHQNTLILNPTIFAHLAPQQLRELEALGAQKALDILQTYIVRFYKEKLRAESGRGRGRGGRGRRPRGGGVQTPGRPQAANDGLFTTAPLPTRTPKPQLQVNTESTPPMASLQPPPESAPSPVIVVDDDDEDAHVSKRPRLEGEDP